MLPMMSFMAGALAGAANASRGVIGLDLSALRGMMVGGEIGTMKTIWAGAAAALLALATGPVIAQNGLPAPADAAERAAMPDLVALLSARGEPAEFDVLLARFPRPTPLRGIVQAARSKALLGRSWPAEAKAAAEEAIRLTPGMAGPRIAVADVLTFAGAPREAADVWLEASVLSPEMARHTDTYVMSAMVGRLLDAGDRFRADKVRVRMDELGQVAALAPDRSDGAFARVQTALAAGDVSVARAAVPGVIAPVDLLALYVDRRYAALWPVVEEWAAPDFTGAQLRYLVELRREFRNRSDLEPAVDYARALAALRQYQTIVDLFLPLTTSEQQQDDRLNFAFLAPVVARALTAVGRSSEAIALLERTGRFYPANNAAMALNMSGSIVRLAYSVGRWSDAERDAARWLAKADALGPDVNLGAKERVSTLRACALVHLGRAAGAESLGATLALARARNHANLMSFAACRNDLAQATATMIAWLADPDARASALDR